MAANSRVRTFSFFFFIVYTGSEICFFLENMFKFNIFVRKQIKTKMQDLSKNPFEDKVSCEMYNYIINLVYAIRINWSWTEWRTLLSLLVIYRIAYHMMRADEYGFVKYTKQETSICSVVYFLNLYIKICIKMCIKRIYIYIYISRDS